MGIKARILVDCLGYKPDQIVDFPPHLAAHLTDDGAIDPHKDAVSYCLETLGASVVIHGDVQSQPVADKPARRTPARNKGATP